MGIFTGRKGNQTPPTVSYGQQAATISTGKQQVYGQPQASEQTYSSPPSYGQAYGQPAA
jgi:hypothetical protein